MPECHTSMDVVEVTEAYGEMIIRRTRSPAWYLM